MAEALKKRLLRGLPSVDELARSISRRGLHGKTTAGLINEASRAAIEEARTGIISGERGDVSIEELKAMAVEKLEEVLKPGVFKVINATGTILHTNIGRALLSKEAVDAVLLAAGNPVNLEIDLKTGARGLRDGLVEDLLVRLTDAEAVSVVNNNAAAVLITLNTLAEGREVIVSRGELIEIGGSFRLPDIIRKSGSVLREVGTTNRTHPEDYIKALTRETAVIFKAHRSNFSVSGFTSEVGLKELSSIGERDGIPVVEDLGSGALIDLSAYGLPREPVVRERLAMGADIVTFSGDKLLGGPQSGLIVGKKGLIERINRNPLKRALRADKLTLSALEATLRLYLDPGSLKDRLPSLRYMTRTIEDIREAAEKARGLLEEALGKDFTISVEDSSSVIGGGAMPGKSLPTKAVSIVHKTRAPGEIFSLFLSNKTPILGRVSEGRFMLDLRTVEDPLDIVPEREFPE